jgi:hypothetical protein
MIKKTILCGALSTLLFFSCKDMKKKNDSQSNSPEVTVQSPKISFQRDDTNKRVDVKIDGELFTGYVYDEKTPKPILYPIITKSGKTVTRGFPYSPRANERIDHPHHVGLWFNYGDVNGLDFWNNSYAIPEKDKNKYGTIYPEEIVESNDENGTLKIKALWRSPQNVDLLEERTEFKFSEQGNTRFIDRTTTLKALQDVTFTDNKEGMLGIRVTRELELPSNEPAVFTDAAGNATTVEALNTEGVTGDYLSSEGITGNDVWGTRGNWVRLQGVITGDTVAIAILDNKKNVGYPTYWHARGYGLFAANPLGQAIFSNGKETLNFSLKKSESVTFKYRVLIHSGSELKKAEIDRSFDDFNTD